jgi:hypothetical protein
MDSTICILTFEDLKDAKVNSGALYIYIFILLYFRHSLNDPRFFFETGALDASAKCYICQRYAAQHPKMGLFNNSGTASLVFLLIFLF